jgi:hypothetical protein
MTNRPNPPKLTGMLSMLARVLDVLDDFDSFGGASEELVAWELGIEPSAVTDTWRRAIERGLLAPAARDSIFGEEMWRLSAKGRVMLEIADVTRPEPEPPAEILAFPGARSALVPNPA